VTYALNNYRSLFLSDLHLGSHNCKAEQLYNFLLCHNAQRIYLLGDIVEGHYVKAWPPFHDDVIKLLMWRSLMGTEIIFIPGNHDSIFRHHLGAFGNVKICMNYYHDCVDKSILYVTHGDETDFLPNHLWLRFIILIERITKLPLWEVTRTLLSWVIRRHSDNFERKIRELGYPKTMCGHIHAPKLSKGYMNSGDWVYHCTAIAEHFEGNFELLKG
jgi:UDP-2,3-diacylglucosamine pyrophosphatase LpxH